MTALRNAEVAQCRRRRRIDNARVAPRRSSPSQLQSPRNAASPGTIPIWQPIIAKYHPTLIGECEKSFKWSKEMVKEWLITGMFAGEADATTKADRIIEELADHAITLSHARHIAVKKAQDLGVKVVVLEAPQNKDLQDAVLTVHHACIQTLSGTGAFRIIENQNGVGFLQVLAPAVITG